MSKREENERKAKEMRKAYQGYFDSIGEPDALFIPKPPYYVKDSSIPDQKVVTFWESELKKERDIYIEFCNFDNDRVDETLTLYRWNYNPYWKDDSEGYETTVVANYPKYIVPISELQRIGDINDWGQPAADPVQTELFKVTKDHPVKQTALNAIATTVTETNLDSSIKDFTMRDLLSVVYRRPMSDKIWLNSVIKNLNSGIEI